MRNSFVPIPNATQYIFSASQFQTLPVPTKHLFGGLTRWHLSHAQCSSHIHVEPASTKEPESSVYVYLYPSVPVGQPPSGGLGTKPFKQNKKIQHGIYSNENPIG